MLSCSQIIRYCLTLIDIQTINPINNIGLIYSINKQNLIVILTMISSLLKLQSTRALPISSKDDNTNYKELYLQCKQNVAVFMKHVDKEISAILKSHEQQKKKLEAEIQNLKLQLQHAKNDVSVVARQNSSCKSVPSKKYNSQAKDRNNTSVSKQTVQQCLAKFSGFDVKTIVSERKTSIQGSLINDKGGKTRSFRKTTYNEEKENHFLTSQLTQNDQIEGITLEPLRFISNLPIRRQKRMRQKKANDKADKVENIKDVLKNIRGKLNSCEKPRFFKAQQEFQKPALTVITPEMFNTSRSNRN